MIIDTHSHIYLNTHQSVDEIISWLKNDRIEKIITIGVDLESSQTAIDMARKYPEVVSATIGIHPCYVKNEWICEDVMQKLENLYLENRDFVVGIWETGYDFYHNEVSQYQAEKTIQEQFFIGQIELAKKYNLPLIIHTRNSKHEVFETLSSQNAKKYILHCFSEDLEFAQKNLDYSDECKVSFSGIVTYKSAHEVHKTAASIPYSRIIVETDSPYLAPQAVRGTQNIPNNTRYTLERVFELQKNNGLTVSFEEFENEIYKNSLEIFGLK